VYVVDTVGLAFGFVILASLNPVDGDHKYVGLVTTVNASEVSKSKLKLEAPSSGVWSPLLITTAPSY
jgi:hypothetical protein